MKIQTKLAIVLTGLIPALGFAQRPKKSGYRLPPYGMAGCGLGSMLFDGPKDNTKVTQILVLTTNNYFFPQSSAITSGSSNCTNSPADSEEAFRIERETYVSMNLGDLNKEAAQGQGDRLRGLSEMLGCGEQNEVQAFAQVAQLSHSEIFSDVQATDVTNRWVNKANENDVLKSCLTVK